jgi:hypothetical protein
VAVDEALEDADVVSDVAALVVCDDEADDDSEDVTVVDGDVTPHSKKVSLK